MEQPMHLDRLLGPIHALLFLVRLRLKSPKPWPRILLYDI